MRKRKGGTEREERQREREKERIRHKRETMREAYK